MFCLQHVFTVKTSRLEPGYQSCMMVVKFGFCKSIFKSAPNLFSIHAFLEKKKREKLISKSILYLFLYLWALGKRSVVARILGIPHARSFFPRRLLVPTSICRQRRLANYLENRLYLQTIYL